MPHQNRIRETRIRLGLTQAALAERVGASAQQISKLEKGERGLDLDWMRRLAVALRCRMVDLLPENDGTAPLQRINICGEVAAGVFRESAEWPPDEQYTLEIPSGGRYPRARRYGLVVSGPSMNLVYPEGTILICVSIEESGHVPEDRDRVIVERRTADGLVEATVKEYVIGEDHWPWLWPRSSHPEHQSPYPLKSSITTHQIEHLAITGLVIGSYRPE